MHKMLDEMLDKIERGESGNSAITTRTMMNDDGRSLVKYYYMKIKFEEEIR